MSPCVLCPSVTGWPSSAPGAASGGDAGKPVQVQTQVAKTVMTSCRRSKEAERFSSKKRAPGTSRIYLQMFEGQCPREKAKAACCVKILLQEGKDQDLNRPQLATRKLADKFRADQQCTGWPCGNEFPVGGSIQGKYMSCVDMIAVRMEAKIAPSPGL